MRLWAYMAAFLGVSVASKVAGSRMLAPMRNHAFFLSQLPAVVLTPVFFVVAFWRARGSLSVFSGRGLPHFQLGAMALLDLVASVMVTFGSVRVSPSMGVLLLQAVTPVSMLLRVLLQGKRYSTGELLGSATIMVGIMVLVQPSVLSARVDEPAVDGMFWILFVLASTVPLALANMYREFALQKIHMESWLLNAWVAMYQSVLGAILVAPVAAVEGIPVASVPDKLVSGFRCWALEESTATLESSDQCQGAFWDINAYLVLILVLNVSMTEVIKLGSATIMYLVSALSIALANIAFSMPIFMGENAQHLQTHDITGLCVILGGIGLNRWASSRSSHLVGEQRFPILTRDGYYTRPPISQLQAMEQEKELGCVWHFCVGHVDHGEVRFRAGLPVDLRGLDLDKFISFSDAAVKFDFSGPDSPHPLNCECEILLRGVTRGTRNVSSVYDTVLKIVSEDFQGEFICYEFEDDSVRFGVPDLSRGQYSLLLTEQQVESDADSCDSSSKSRLDQELDSGEQSDDEDPMALLSPS